MVRLYSKYYSIHYFAVSLLKGTFDQQIYRALYKRAKEMETHRFRHLDPTLEVEFEITLENEDEPLIITTDTMDDCQKWTPDYSEYERRLVLLISFIIKDIHKQVLKTLNFEEMEASKKQPVDFQ
jgi:hypothetical protein